MIQEKINIFRLREPMIKSFYVVNDAVSNQNTGGFKDGNTNPALNDYEYDANDFRVKDFEKVFGEESERSSMVKDRNKGIESITYNHLNLPTKVTWSNEKYISYQYNAAGQKISKSVRENDSIKIVEYLDGFQYAGEVLQFFPHTEGYVKVTALSAGRGLPTSDFAFNYVFNYTDHLGNVRLSYTKDPQTGTLDIMDENHYYPFGLKHGIYAAGNLKDFTLNGAIDTPILEQVRKTEYQYKYNGKELQDELGLNWYDYGARNYDATIGRWMNIDPMAPKYFTHSPYAYALNNPVYFIDPDGMQVAGPGDEIINEDDPIELEMVVITHTNPTSSRSSSSSWAYLPPINMTNYVFGRDGRKSITGAYTVMNRHENIEGFRQVQQAKREGEMFMIGVFAVVLAPEFAMYGSVMAETKFGLYLMQTLGKTGIDATAQFLISGDVNWLNAAAGSVLPGKWGTALSPIMSEGADISRNLINNEPINFEKSLLKVGTGYIGNGLGGAAKSVGADNGFNAVQNFIFENGIQSFHNTLQTTIIDTKVD